MGKGWEGASFSVANKSEGEVVLASGKGGGDGVEVKLSVWSLTEQG